MKSMTNILGIMLILLIDRGISQTYQVTLKNVTESGTHLSGTYLSIYYPNGNPYELHILSGSSRMVPAGIWKFGTDEQYIEARKHQYWNTLNSSSYHLRYDDEVFTNTTESAIFVNYNNVTFNLNSNVTGTDEHSWLEFRDPWWVQVESSQYQPDQFFSFEELGITSSHAIFQNMVIYPYYPYYSLRAPELIASTDGIYQFQSWGTITGANSQTDPAHPLDPHFKAIQFTSSTVTINVNYSQVNKLSGTYTIPDGDRLIIPDGAVIACNPGFK